MQYFNLLSDSELVAWYTEKHLTAAEIGARVGLTRQAIHKRLKKLGIRAAQGEHILVACFQCGKRFDMVRSRFRNQNKHFCNEACRRMYLGNEAFVQYRWSGVQARKIVKRYFPLLDHHIVHHKDANQQNNELSN